MPSQSQDRTAAARAALQRKFLDLAGGDPQIAERLRSAHYRRLQSRSVQKRHQKRAARNAAMARLLEIQTGQRILTEDELLDLLQAGI